MRTALIYNFLIEANLMASIAILLMIPVRWLCRRQLGSRAIAFAWLLVAIRLLCPLALPNPVIHEIRSAFAPDLAIRPIAGQVQVRFADAVDALYDGIRLSGSGSAIEESLHTLRDDTGNGMLSIRLMKVYLAGAALTVGWFAISNWRFRKQLRADRIEPISGRALAQYRALCAEMHIRPIPVSYVDPLPSACLVGCFRPYIALPLTARPQELEHVLRHELCHYKAGDHWWCAVRLACCAIHWFNPLVWLAARMSRTDAELACDERVIRHMDEARRRSYAGVLVLSACRRDLPGISVLSTGMSMTGRRLKKRVMDILSNRQARRGLALGFVLLASMALIGAFCTAERPVLAGIPADHMAYQSQPVSTAVSLTQEQEQQAIDLAKAFWSNETLQADLNDSLVWTACGQGTHTEVYANDPEWGEALILAFAPDGRILYMNNRRSGDRDALLASDPNQELSRAELNGVMEYGLSVLEKIQPGLRGEMGEMESQGPTVNGESSFYRFFSFRREGENHSMTHVFNVQVFPEVRLTHYENLLEFDEDASDRLEPGNG
ncbi:MAG: M56 family metallopeptidase [Clostridia bacterium]|nr:M56 family metallopeptidase [Clostridia bacterium]